MSHSFATPLFPSRLPGVGTSVFTVFSQQAQALGAVNLGQGFPDFDPDPRLLSAVKKALHGGFNQYAPMPGLPALRSRLASKVEQLYGHAYNPDTEITITSGATQALFTTIQVVVQPGDEVIVLEPVYDSYVPAIRLAGGTAVGVPLAAPTAEQPGFRPDWDAVRAAITPRTRAIVLNFPHNPTGAILHDADLDAIEALVAGTELVLISDEVYEHIVFDGEPHRSLASRPALAARSFVISSFGKTLHTTGWKIGYVCAPAPYTAEFRRAHQFTVFAVSTPMQQGIATFLEDPAPYLELPAFYQERRDHLAQGLTAAGFTVLPCPGTYFLLATHPEMAALGEAGFCERLMQVQGVAALPLSAFYLSPPDGAQPWVRFCFAKQPETLDAALSRLHAAPAATAPLPAGSGGGRQ